MTTREWNQVIEFLETAKEGNEVEYESRIIEVTYMAGGKFLLWEKDSETGWQIVGQTDEEWRAAEFLKSGKLLIERKCW